MGPRGGRLEFGRRKRLGRELGGGGRRHVFQGSVRQRVLRRGRHPGRGRFGFGSWRRGGSIELEDEPRLADADHVAFVQANGFHRMPVDRCAIGALEVEQTPGAVFHPDLRMFPGDFAVIEHEIGGCASAECEAGLG